MNRNMNDYNGIAYIEVCINGYWQQISSGMIGSIQQDLDQLKRNSNDPLRAVDSNGRLVAIQ